MRHLAKDYLWFWMVLLQRFVQHRGISSAAALTYTSLFAVVPLLTVTFAVISAIPFFHVGRWGGAGRHRIYDAA